MRRFLCLLKNRLERLAIYSLLKKFVLIGFLTVPLSFLLSSNVFADTVQVSSPTIYWRAYTTNGELTSQAFNSTSNLPRVILSYQAGEYRTLQGFTIDFGVQDTLQTRFKTLVTKARLTQTDAEGVSGTDPHKSLANPISWVTAGTTVQDVTGGKCSTQWLDKYNLEYTCTVNLDEYKTITNAQVTLGWAPTSVVHADPLAVLCGTDISPNCAGNVLLSRFSYELSGKDSPTDANVEKIYSEVQVTNDLLQQQIDRDNQDRDDISQSKDDADATAEDLSQDIDNASSSLLTIIGNFVNVIINPPQRDCVIDGDMGHMNLGQIDLCELSLPPSFQVISTLLMIGFIIPFAYSLISTFLSLLKGATQD